MTAALPAHARRQSQLALLLSRRPLTLAEAASELGISSDDAGHVLRRLRANGFEVVRIDSYEPEPHWRVLYPKGRVCAAEGCDTILRRTNSSERCESHGGGFVNPQPPREAAVRMDGDALREAREARGLTLREFAEPVGLSPGFVSRLETRRRPVTVAVAQRLERRFARQ